MSEVLVCTCGARYGLPAPTDCEDCGRPLEGAPVVNTDAEVRLRQSPRLATPADLDPSGPVEDTVAPATWLEEGVDVEDEVAKSDEWMQRGLEGWLRGWRAFGRVLVRPQTRLGVCRNPACSVETMIHPGQPEPARCSCGSEMASFWNCEDCGGDARLQAVMPAVRVGMAIAALALLFAVAAVVGWVAS